MITYEFNEATDLLMREVCNSLGGIQPCGDVVLTETDAARLATLEAEVAALTPAEANTLVATWGDRPRCPLLDTRPALAWLLDVAFDGPLSRRFTEAFDEFPDEEEEDVDPEDRITDSQERGPY